uniref:Galectin domain-containing protein n=1 Tax=Megaselia scalaris TaxID=36166 RepID=T1GIE5_MEGSC
MHAALRSSADMATKSSDDTGTFTVLNPDGVTTKIQFSLSEITCVQCCSEAGSPRIALHAPKLKNGCSPIKLQFSGDSEMEDWISHFNSVCSQINAVYGKPSRNSIWTTSNLGDVEISALETPYYNNLCNGMPIGTDLDISGCVYDDADQIRFDLQCHHRIKTKPKIEKYRMIAMHLNPRFNEKTIVFNTMEESEWCDEIRNDDMVFAPGHSFNLLIRSTNYGYEIFINKKLYFTYKHKIDPDSVSCLYVSGRVKLFKILYKCKNPIIPILDCFWRPIGGHLKKVYACQNGIVWGIGCDNTPWAYTGGCGGTFIKGVESPSGKIHSMTDTHNFYVYENQRWNPLSGYNTTGLPTDRHMWSDVTGKQKRSKEHTKLLSMHFQWISDWMVDFQTPGGVDKDGWQYAVDFPSSYHANKKITDYVRRRRFIPNDTCLDTDEFIDVWAVTTNGEVLIRNGVCESNPCGQSWDHIPSEATLAGICISGNGKIWSLDRSGTVYYRYGITKENNYGDTWQALESPQGVVYKQIAAGEAGIWALDTQGRLSVRMEINQTFPEGSHWKIIPNIPKSPPSLEAEIGFKSITVGKEVWAISKTGIVCKRCGINKINPAGSGWQLGIPGDWQYISAEGL